MIDETDGQSALFDAAPTAFDVARSLRDDYVVPPFSLLDTRQGYWQDRRAQWGVLGMQSELGRDGNLTYGAFTNPDVFDVGEGGRYEAVDGGTVSIFDPVLTEIAYRWFSGPTATVYDPFAGGSVRGIIAAALGREYFGIELRGEQCEANRRQAIDIVHGARVAPTWHQGDSAQATTPLVPCDMIFTCPPYGDLEVYSDDPADLSNMGAEAFDEAYRQAIDRAVWALRPNRFAAIVVGNYRDKKTGRLRDLCGLTVRSFESSGARYYNEAILLNSVGTGAVRARKQFDTSRKLVRMHQTMLVFVKGDARLATAAADGMVGV